MAKIVECIPNFSEGIRQDVISQIADVIKAIPGVTLLDYSSDPNHNRSVFSFLGCPEGVESAAFEAAQKASQLIDLRVHKGEHPRMGATDVIPFVPIKDMATQECVEMSLRVGKRISDELGIPVFLYEESATKPERRNLATIRKGQFEGMNNKMKDPDWTPDYGKPEVHPSAGVVAVGARMPLVAYNINLNTSDLSVANRIAKIIRESSGGLKYVKSIGVMLESRNIAQVSINMTNYAATPLYRVFEMVKFEAKRYGVEVIGSEIIGLTPMNALVDSAMYYLQLEGFDPEKQVLENRLLNE